MSPRVLDLFCGAGGASMGYHRAGFEVVGVDINPQPNYPFEFLQANALDVWPGGFDLVHASPPCQLYSRAQKIQNRAHPDLIPPVREMLQASGVPYIIENVEGSPLVDPVTLCGAMFGLGTYRHRLFETSFDVDVPAEPIHDKPNAKMGRKPNPGEMMHVVGHFSGVAAARSAMGIDWMTRDEMAESIPPAYTQFIAEQFLAMAVVA